MRLEYNSPEVKDLVAILLDGKPITLNMCRTADDEEGWVESYVPRGVPGADTAMTPGFTHNHELVRRKGKVQFIFRKQE